MATEKTSLLHNNLILTEIGKVKEVIVVAIPKQVTDDDNDIWSGLSRDQLIPYINDPFWRKIRIVLLIIFWIVVSVMFASALGIAGLEYYGKCSIKTKVINLNGIENDGVINGLSIIDGLNHTHSLAS